MSPEAFAAALSAIAAIAAAFAAWRMPASAAKLASQLSTQQAGARRAYDAKFSLFQTLMQEREEIWSIEAVRALNSIDVVFVDARGVREAWSDLHRHFNVQPTPNWASTQEKIRVLLKMMAADLNLTHDLREDDFSRTYFPSLLREVREIERLQRQQLKQQLTGLSGPSAPGKSKPISDDRS